MIVRAVLSLVAVLLTSELALAQEATEAASSPQKPSAEKLVRKIIADEAKIEEVKSIYLRFEGKWTNTPEAISARRIKLQSKYPDLEVTEDKFPEIRPVSKQELEIAWDKERLRSLTASPQHVRILRIWDGSRAIIHDINYTKERDSISLYSSPQRVGDVLLNETTWLKVGPAFTWFYRPEISDDNKRHALGRPNEFVLTGTVNFRGRRCLELRNTFARRRLFVGADDLRLYGIDIMFLPTESVRSSSGLERISKAARRDFASLDDFDSWFSNASRTEREDYTNRIYKKFAEFNQSLCLYYLDEYREIAPGLWCPAKQGSTNYENIGGKHLVASHRELRLVESSVNEPLDDGLFTIKMKEGVQVHDWGHDPPLHYKYKADRSPEEWQAIVDEAKRDDERMNRAIAAREALIGKRAPDFPDTTWLNGDPLTWDKLRGKVVILDFWAIWCGPCRGDVPSLNALQKTSQETSIVVIGVHNPGSELADIENHLEEFEMKFPIVIDTSAPKNSSSWGTLSSQFAVDHLPCAFVIDQQGNIAGHGTLAEVAVLARKLAAQE